MIKTLFDLGLAVLQTTNSNPVDTSHSTQNNVSKDTVDYLYSQNPFVSVSGGAGTIAKVYDLSLHLDQNSEVDLDTLFFAKSNVNFSVHQANEKLKKIRKYIENNFYKNPDSLQKTNLEYLIGLEEVLKNEFVGSSSVSKVNKAVSDNCINVRDDSLFNENGWQIQPGHYLLVAKSKNQSVPALINLDFDRFEKNYNFVFHEKKDSGKDSCKVKKSSVPLELIAGSTILGNKAGFEGGIKYGPIAILGSYNSAEDEVVSENKSPVTDIGTYGYGKISETDQKGIGVAGEIHLGNFFGGLGYTRWKYSQNVLEQFKKNEIILKENTNSKSKSRDSFRYYFGAGIPIGNKIGADAYLGKDNKKGFLGGIRLRYNFNPVTKHKGAKK